MNAIFEVINARHSVGKLHAPAPSREELHALLLLAMSAPDHKRLSPWRFVVLENTALDAFGERLVLAGEQQARSEGAVFSNAERQKLASTPKRAPMIIAVATDYKDHPKVPHFEQLLAVGACVQNLLLGLQSLGYASIWRTGLLANHPVIQDFFAVTGDNLLAGFIYVGSSEVAPPQRVPPLLDDFVSFRF